MASSNLVAVHEKTKSYDWEFTFAEQGPKFPSKFKMPKKGKDPFRFLVRDYVKSESEKDQRTHGFLDGAVRSKDISHIEPRFAEWLKVGIPFQTHAEFQGMAACGTLISSFANQEIRQGYAAQLLDEMRHAQLSMGVRHYYTKYWDDPAGFDCGQPASFQHPAGLTSLAEFQHFNTGDPVDSVVAMGVVQETAYTNMFFLAIPHVAALNGDNVFPAVMLSIQSDEARHMANGYGALMSLLSEEDNVPMLNDTLERHLYHAHKSMHSTIGWGTEYHVRQRPWAYKDQWEEWVVDDFVGNYLDRLGEFGINQPRFLGLMAEEVVWQHHTVAQMLTAVWPLNFWRSHNLDPEDFEWFEQNYPGWYANYGDFWEAHREMNDPANGQLMMANLPGLPPMCQVCQLPCVLPRIDINDIRTAEFEGRQIALCGQGCEWIFQRWPKAYGSRRQLWDRYHGWDLADVILDLGYVRPDGKTLIGQPSIDPEQRLWTIDDIRKVGYEIKDPMRAE
jgi:methane monooxygenase component A alpha chain/propane monooxygenase large subunit